MNNFSMPEEFAEQKQWADHADTGLLDRQWYQWRQLATRRILLAGIAQAFEEIPQLEGVEFRFMPNAKSVKDSIFGYGSQLDLMDHALTAKLAKHLTSTRSRIGASTQTFDGLALFFREGRKLTRDNYQAALPLLFNENQARWDDELDARIANMQLDRHTGSAPATRTAPRL